MITIEQGNKIRETWYVMDGLADRPKTVPECWDVIEEMLELIGNITGITNAGAISPDEETPKDIYLRELKLAEDAHELPLELVRTVETTLYGPSMTEDPTDDRYAKAAQLIACSRNTCGGPNAAHEHTA